MFNPTVGGGSETTQGFDLASDNVDALRINIGNTNGSSFADWANGTLNNPYYVPGGFTHYLVSLDTCTIDSQLISVYINGVNYYYGWPGASPKTHASWKINWSNIYGFLINAVAYGDGSGFGEYGDIELWTGGTGAQNQSQSANLVCSKSNPRPGCQTVPPMLTSGYANALISPFDLANFGTKTNVLNTPTTSSMSTSQSTVNVGSCPAGGGQGMTVIDTTRDVFWTGTAHVSGHNLYPDSTTSGSFAVGQIFTANSVNSDTITNVSNLAGSGYVTLAGVHSTLASAPMAAQMQGGDGVGIVESCAGGVLTLYSNSINAVSTGDILQFYNWVPVPTSTTVNAYSAFGDSGKPALLLTGPASNWTSSNPNQGSGAPFTQFYASSGRATGQVYTAANGGVVDVNASPSVMGPGNTGGQPVGTGGFKWICNYSEGGRIIYLTGSCGNIISVGDLLLIAYIGDSNTVVNAGSGCSGTAPPGFIEISNYSDTYAKGNYQSSGGDYSTVCMAYKVATASDVATNTGGFTSGTVWSFTPYKTMVALIDYASNGPTQTMGFDTSSLMSVDGAGSTTPAFPLSVNQVTPANNNDIILGFYFAYQAPYKGPFSCPGGMTKRFDAAMNYGSGPTLPEIMICDVTLTGGAGRPTGIGLAGSGSTNISGSDLRMGALIAITPQ
jgi:hypothetical protein